MTYPLDEPTTEDEAATDPHAAREQTSGVGRMAGDTARERAAAVESTQRQHGAAAMQIATIVKPAHDAVVIETPVAPITPLRLPAIGRAAARVTRTVCDTRVTGHLHATLGVTEWHASLADAHSFDAAYADPGVIELTIASADGISTVAVRVALDLHAYPALSITAWPDGDALTAKPPADVALRHAVAGVVLEPLFERLIHAGFKGPRVVAVRRGRLNEAMTTRKPTGEANADLPVVALSFVLDERRYQAALSADPACYDLLDRLLRAEAAPASVSSHGAAAAASTASSASSDRTPETAFDLTVPGSLILGVKRLPVDTLHALEPGDVLLRAAFPSLDATLLDASSVPSSPHARPRAIAAWGTPGLTRVCATVELDGQSLVIVKEPNMSEELDPASADAGLAIDDPADPIRIGELELPVQFEIDTVALPLAQLSALGPGYVLELPVPVADAQLRLVAHGQTIGYGELVTVGEHLGIRIIRMAHRHGPIQ
ncbi:type III secretion system cytoplasmic ring protein SctQ [Paraburkholderia sediminicola]|uniref:type III secretion system cytoplasmic ring protein SctQ n=1 Tax=Paraburkholderia sediminicola TaxID=458836 RepID=UPI0038BC845E